MNTKKTSNRLRVLQIAPSTIGVKDVNRLITVCNDLNERAKDFQFSHERGLESNKPLDDAKLREHIENIMIVTVGVWGSNGDYIAFRSVDEILEKDLPDKIYMIQIDNSNSFNFSVGIDPLHHFKIIFDCESHAVFGAQASPSTRTPNTSEMRTMGVDTAWVEGSYATLLECLEPRKHKLSWIIHRDSVYDAFLWVLFAPVFCSVISKFDSVLQKVFYSYSQSFSFIVYLLGFIICLILFKLVFVFVRWLLPYIEFVNHSPNAPLVLRKGIVGIIGILLAGGIYDFVKWISGIV